MNEKRKMRWEKLFHITKHWAKLGSFRVFPASFSTFVYCFALFVGKRDVWRRLSLHWIERNRKTKKNIKIFLSFSFFLENICLVRFLLNEMLPFVTIKIPFWIELMVTKCNAVHSIVIVCLNENNSRETINNRH